MLSKKHRLPSYLIPKLLKRGQRLHADNFTLIYQPSTINNFPRFAFIIPIKLEKRAVYRNRLKRLLRQTVKYQIKKIKKGYNILLLANKAQRSNKPPQISAEVITLLQKAKIIK